MNLLKQLSTPYLSPSSLPHRQYLWEGGRTGDSDDLVYSDEGDHDHGGASHAPANHVSPPRELLRVVSGKWLVGYQTVHNDHLARHRGR